MPEWRNFNLYARLFNYYFFSNLVLWCGVEKNEMLITQVWNASRY
jgi:hypothetical protein